MAVVSEEKEYLGYLGERLFLAGVENRLRPAIKVILSITPMADPLHRREGDFLL